MKICISTYSFHRSLEAASMTLYDVADFAKAHGAQGIEIVDTCVGDMKTEAQAHEFAAYCEKIGLEIPSFCTWADLLAPDFDAQVARLCTMVDRAAAFGCKTMRHDATGGDFRKDRHTKIGYADGLETLAKGCRNVTAYAKTHGIRTLTENHGYFSQDADRVEMLINAVGDENFGALVDIGNFLCADENPPLSVGKLAPYAGMVHAKDFHVLPGDLPAPGEGWFRSRGGNYLRGAIIGHGNAHVTQSLGVLKRAGYDGFISVEFEGMEEESLGVRLGISNLRRFWGAL